MQLAGLVAYLRVLVAPRRAFAQLIAKPAWGWAAIIGLALTLLAVELSQAAQTHMMAVIETQRLAAMAPGERLREQLAAAQAASLRHTFFIVGALVAPWLVWSLITIFLFAVAVFGRGRPQISTAWVASLNSYAPYGVAGVLNATLVALADPSSISQATDLVRLPSPALLASHSPHVAAFLTAYNLGAIWYYVVFAIALETMMRVPRAAAIAATMVYSLLFGALAAFGVSNR